MKTFTTLLTILTTLFIAACTNQQTPQLAVNDPDDFGIGGTGIIAGNQQGTGVIGMITGYGSIFVNGIEIETENQVTISVDGSSVKAHNFEIGEVVEVLTRDTQAHTQAQHINIRHEIIGPVSHYDPERQTAIILGQTVYLSNANKVDIKIGDRLAVSGFTDPAGQIHASHIKTTANRDILQRRPAQTEQPPLPFNKVTKWVIQGYLENYASHWKLDKTNPGATKNRQTIVFEVTQADTNSTTIKVLSPDRLKKGASSRAFTQQKGMSGHSSPSGRQSGFGGGGRGRH